MFYVTEKNTNSSFSTCAPLHSLRVAGVHVLDLCSLAFSTALSLHSGACSLYSKSPAPGASRVRRAACGLMLSLPSSAQLKAAVKVNQLAASSPGRGQPAVSAAGYHAVCSWKAAIGRWRGP